MDNHESHRTDEFIVRCKENNIIPFTFPSHLTHILQPLDVGCFQSWKHWHDEAITTALSTLEFDYNISLLLRDLKTIRTKTFKPSTIKEAWKQAGLHPINFKMACTKMNKYVKAQKAKEAESRKRKRANTDAGDDEPTLPPLPPAQLSQRAQQRLSSLQLKLNDKYLFSDGTEQELNEVVGECHALLSQGQITMVERDMLHSRVVEAMKRKPHSRKRLQYGGQLDGDLAKARLNEKDALARKVKAEKEQLAIKKQKKKEAKEHHAWCILCRKAERNRKRYLDEVGVLPGDRGAAHIMIPVPDEEAMAKAARLALNHSIQPSTQHQQQEPSYALPVVGQEIYRPMGRIIVDRVQYQSLYAPLTPNAASSNTSVNATLSTPAPSSMQANFIRLDGHDDSDDDEVDITVGNSPTASDVSDDNSDREKDVDDAGGELGGSDYSSTSSESESEYYSA